MSDASYQSGSVIGALAPSLDESVWSGEGLPHGAPPERLRQIDSSEELPWELTERARGLIANGLDAIDRSPTAAAMCWHEAGRLLDRRGRRPGEAWICHSLALKANGDHEPARDALRRLARRSGDREALARVLSAQVDLSSDSLEAAALLSEKAALELLADESAEALDSLRQATRADSAALVPQLLKLGAAAREADDGELAESLGALASAWPEPEGAAGAQLILALIEERLGRIDEALDRLSALGQSTPLAAAGHWARFRLGLRAGRQDDAISALAELSGTLSAPAMREAVERLRCAIATLTAEEATASSLPADAERAELTWDLDLLRALGETDRAAEARAEQAAARSCRSTTLAATALGAAALARAADRDELADVPPEVTDAGAYGVALKAYLRVGQERTSWAPGFDRESDPVAVLHHALTHDEHQAAADALAALRERALDADERWDIAVAEAALRREHLGDPERALEVLRSSTDELDRSPLPSLIRLHDRSPRSLADLARAEAAAAEDPATESWLLAWAGHHLEGVDPDESSELHRRALEINPTCPLSLAALERHATDHATLAESFASAAAASTTSEERARNLVRAGVHHLATGSERRALELFGQALETIPDDRDLWRSVIRLAVCHSGHAQREYLDSPPFADELEPNDLLYLGLLGLAVDPAAGARWFEKAVAATPEDPVCQIGLTEALLAADRWSVVSSRLLGELREAATPADEALIYARMADIDTRYGDDPSSALLSLMSLEERLPGHRPTLARLALYFARQSRNEELVDVLASLAGTLDDDDDGAALATAAWQMSKLDLGVLRRAVSRDPAAILALTELEARTADADERRELLGRIVECLAGSGTYLSRLADACEAVADHERAVQLRQSALEAAPDSILELHGLERAQRALGDLAGVADTLLRHAGCTALSEHKVESLLQAARLARDQLGDAPRAASIYLDVMEVDPLEDEAYQQGRELLEQTGDLAQLDRLIGLRIGGTEDRAAKHRLLLELADVRLRNHDRQGTKVALGLALELTPNDLPTRRRLAQLHREDSEWSEAIDNLMEAARLARDPETGIAIFYALGELYMDHTERKDLAEKSFVKVLGWDRSHFPAMERLADLYGELGNWTRSAQALERLVSLATDPAVKVRKIVALAGVLESKLERARDGENLLNEARRVDPGAIAPVEALAAMYARQQDKMALNVLLDQSLAQQSLAAAADPDDAATYGNIMIILTMKAADDIASLAAAAIREVGGTPPTRSAMNSNPPEAQWDVGGRVADPALEDFLCPKAIPAGLRGTLRAVEEPVARMLGATVKQLGLAKDARVDRKHALSQAVARLLPAFGLRQEPTFYAGAGSELRIAPGSPPAVMVPRSALEGDDERVFNFVATASLVLTRSGLALPTLCPEDRLRRIVAGLVRMCVPSAETPPGIEPEELAQEVEALKQVIPAKTLAQIQPLAFDANAALEHPDLRDNVLTIGHRAGFIAAGSLTSALAGLRALASAPGGGLAGLPGAGRLVAFVFSKDHLELRQRMGL